MSISQVVHGLQEVSFMGTKCVPSCAEQVAVIGCSTVQVDTTLIPMMMKQLLLLWCNQSLCSSHAGSMPACPMAD